MATIRISEQISFLRKQKGLTQEELANTLGVTNQAVSKWESAQSCPDIQLIPDIAKIFNVSVDELLGITPVSTSEDIVLALRKKIESLPKGEDAEFTFRIAAALHTIIFSKNFSKEMTADIMNPSWDTDAAIEQAGSVVWGCSGYNMPELTTTMRHGAVFFSNNKDFILTKTDIYRIAEIIKSFSEAINLRIATALYQLTVHSADAYASVAQISNKSDVLPEKVQNCLEGDLAQLIIEKHGMESEFRFDGMYMNILPIFSLLDI